MGWVFGLVAALGGGAFLIFRNKKVSLANVLPNGMLHLFTPIPSPPTATKVFQSGTAKPSATALYNYLRATGTATSPTLASLVTAFQTADNADPDAVKIGGPLQVTGVYDNPTSAALTLYTHDPIPPATPPAPTPPPATKAEQEDDSVPGSSASSSFNLYTYLKAHGNDRSTDEAHFVKQFQLDFNTDPKGLGPPSLIPVIKSQLATTGVYDTATAHALAAYTNDAVNP